MGLITLKDSLEDTTGELIESNDSLEDATGSDLELLWLTLCLFDIIYSEVSLSMFCIEFSVFFNILSKLDGTILIFFLIFDSIYFIEGLFFVFEVLIIVLDTSFILGRSKIESEFTIKSGDIVFIISS